MKTLLLECLAVVLCILAPVIIGIMLSGVR